jgi:hypothetical protein
MPTTVEDAESFVARVELPVEEMLSYTAAGSFQGVLVQRNYVSHFGQFQAGN